MKSKIVRGQLCYICDVCGGEYAQFEHPVFLCQRNGLTSLDMGWEESVHEKCLPIWRINLAFVPQLNLHSLPLLG